MLLVDSRLGHFCVDVLDGLEGAFVAQRFVLFHRHLMHLFIPVDACQVIILLQLHFQITSLLSANNP